MEAHKTNIYKFIKQTPKFIIPVYQRNYDWKKENCKQLFEDIERIAETGDIHFIGTICTQAAKRYQCVIIDGQQRITSTMLLLKAIYDNTDDKFAKKRIHNLLMNDDTDDAEERIRLKPIKRDEAIFHKLINMQEFNKEKFTDKELCSNIMINYLFFTKLFSETDKDAENIIAAIEGLELVELAVEKENPQVVFESLNSTGLDLTNADLIRNYLLMALEYNTQEELYTKYWLPIDNMFEQTTLEKFFVYYLIKKRKSDFITMGNKKQKITEKNLYNAFKKTYPNISLLKSKENVENCLSDILLHANMYYEFITQTYHTKNKIHKKFFNLFTQLSAHESAIFVMALYEQYLNKIITEDELIDAIDVIITYVIRTKVCGKAGMTAQTASLSIQRLEQVKSQQLFKDKIFDTLMLNKGSYAFPFDNEFKTNLINVDFYKIFRSSGCRYILEKIEKHKSKETVSIDDATIEHIIPQTLSEEWKNYLRKYNDLQNYETNLHTIGNLALTKYNSESSNKPFSEKKVIYDASNFIYTRNISNYDKFTSEEIKHRAEELSEIMLKIWDIPSKYDTNTPLTGDFSFNIDMSKLSYTKPKRVILFGDEYDVKSWREIWILLNKTLFDLNKQQYYNIINSLKLTIISNTKNQQIAQYEIESNKFLNVNLSSYDIVRLMNDIISEFDGINNTNFKNEVVFTTK